MNHAANQTSHQPQPVGAAPSSISLFPANAIRGLFKTYVDMVSPTTESPTAFLWGALLAALSALVGRRAVFDWGPTPVSPPRSA